MFWPKDLPYDPKRRRYYLLSESLVRNPSDYEVLNEEEMYPRTSPFPDGKTYPVMPGRRKFRLPGKSHDSTYGLPNFLTKPIVSVARRNKPLDIYGFHDRRLISSRAKRLLSEIDPTGFDFMECKTISRKSVQVEPYWMMSVARLVTEFDEARSAFELAKGVDGMTGDPYEGPHISHLYDIHMSSDLPQNFHVFLMSRHPLRMVFDEVLADAWRKNRFTGAEFLPLQPPTPKERSGRSAKLSYWSTGRFRDYV